MIPRRIQRRRTKGWRMPPSAVNVTRPGKWSNPYRVDPRSETVVRSFDGALQVLHWDDEKTVNSAALAVELFAIHAEHKASSEPEWLAPLAGKDLACWCPLNQPCHADVLLRLANTPPATEKTK